MASPRSTNVEPCRTLVTVAAPTLRATAFSGDLDLVGDFNLFPSATDTVELLSAGRVHGLGVTGQSSTLVPGQTVATWQASRLNLSDADPASLPSLLSPFSYFNLLAGSASVPLNSSTQAGFLDTLNRVFTETGAVNSVLQTRQTLHAPGLLHPDDPLPLYIHALGGDISGLTLFSAKPARITASRDIADVAFYLQNNIADQVSVVSAGLGSALGLDDSAAQLLAPASGAVAERYLKELASLPPGSPSGSAATWAAWKASPEYPKTKYTMEHFPPRAARRRPRLQRPRRRRLPLPHPRPRRRRHAFHPATSGPATSRSPPARSRPPPAAASPSGPAKAASPPPPPPPPWRAAA